MLIPYSAMYSDSLTSYSLHFHMQRIQLNSNYPMQTISDRFYVAVILHISSAYNVFDIDTASEQFWFASVIDKDYHDCGDFGML